jgi:predicted nucleotidyltransferase
MIMFQQQFAENARDVVRRNDNVIGLAVTGSWLSDEIDEFSDLDLILITKEKVAGDTEKMLGYARSFGKLLNGFTGEHVGEPRLLICLYDQPLLHVDIKFLTLPEFSVRMETPVILHDTAGQLQQVLDTTAPRYPYPDYQWLEDRFWIWVHYATLKIGRGEYFEAMDFLGYLRMVVLGPLLQIRNGTLPRGVRKVETQLSAADFTSLRGTVAGYERNAIILALENAVSLYQELRSALFTAEVNLQNATEEKALAYLHDVKQRP